MKTRLLIAVCLLTTTSVWAQSERSSSSQFLTTIPNSEVCIPFCISDEGVRLPVRWGMDVAWMNEQNLRKGINHIGKNNLSLVRGSFRYNERLVGDTALTRKLIDTLRERMRLTNIISDTVDIILNSDQEPIAGDDRVLDSWYGTGGNSNVANWLTMISAHIDYINKNYPKHRVLGISPYNEPDLIAWKQGSKANMKELSRLLKEKYPGLIITAGNTLNCDMALEWYNAVKPYVDWGCTHQLAGSFDTYANFFKRVKSDGNLGYADELHNVGEAIVGVEYGMQAGVWWGFDSRARGEFCRISNTGSRIGYGENRAKWTSAAVYRDDETQAVKAFIGSSERQANTSTYGFISTDREVYYDGQGPLRAFTMEIPGGTGYQKDQTNAERVIDITYGEDVPPSAITPGVYKLMNYATSRVAAVNGTADGHPNISQMRWTGATSQQWKIDLVNTRIGGDYSFYKITNVQNGKYMNVLNNSLSSANVISYNANCASNEQWYLQYAGNGCYYIRNRESGLYLTLAQKSTANNTNIRQGTLGTNDASRELQMWRILPVEAECELTAPAMPAGLEAESRPASVALQWTANGEEDLAGYMVLRQEKGSDDWNTIARKVSTNSYIDNTCQQGVEYEYKVKAIDLSENQSECSAVVGAQPTAVKGMIARWDFDDQLIDATENYFDAIHGATPVYVTEHAVGEKALVMNGTTDFVQLPYEIADMDEMTISLWAYWTNPSSTNVHIFDFGNGSTQYMYLTPQNGKGICFGIKNGGAEQQLTYGRRLGTRAWKHLVVTLGASGASLYMDGEEIAHSDEVTIKPSDIRASLNYLGRGQTASAAKFRGNIDDVRIFNYALSAEEVKALTEEAISGIELQEKDAPTVGADALYDLQGRRIHRAGQRGIVIQRSDDGTAKKVVVN